MWSVGGQLRRRLETDARSQRETPPNDLLLGKVRSEPVLDGGQVFDGIEGSEGAGRVVETSQLWDDQVEPGTHQRLVHLHRLCSGGRVVVRKETDRGCLVPWRKTKNLVSFLRRSSWTSSKVLKFLAAG